MILKDHETDSTGTSILIPLLLLNFNMRLHGNPTAWYLFLATNPNVSLSETPRGMTDAALGGLTYVSACACLNSEDLSASINMVNPRDHYVAALLAFGRF